MGRTIREKAKNEVLCGEGDAYFERNLTDGKIEIAKGCWMLDEFLSGIFPGGGCVTPLEY